MPLDELDRRLTNAAGEIAPLCFLHGDNDLFIQAAIEGLAARLFAACADKPGIEHMDAREHKPAAILARARTMPLYAAKQLVVVRNAEAFKDAHWQALQSYFQRPGRHCCLVFVAEKLVLKGEVLACFRQQGSVVCFERPRREQDIKQFIRTVLSSHGKTADADALQLLTRRMGSNTQLMARELEKIALYCGASRRVGLADVEQTLSVGYADTIFTLVKEVASGHAVAALQTLHSLLAQGVPALVVLKMIARQLRMISVARADLDGGIAGEGIGKRLGVKPFVLREVLSQARGWSMPVLGRAYDELLRANFFLKAGSQIKESIVLEHLVIRLAEMQRQA